MVSPAFLALSAVCLAQMAAAAPVSLFPNLNMTVGGDKPCCQGACTKPGEEKYWSIAKGILQEKHCGECCMNPKDYKLYHFFEKNLTKSAVDSPCKTFGFTKYDSTVTHGFGPVSMTLDLYDEPKPSPPGPGPAPTPPGPGPAPTPPGPAHPCSSNEYCCPDAKRCLLPTEYSCLKDANACGKGEVCCPLTKICVVPRQPCTAPCPAGAFCSPIKKTCLTPTNPGVFCRGSAPHKCAAGTRCDFTTKVCVKDGEACKPPLPFLNADLGFNSACSIQTGLQCAEGVKGCISQCKAGVEACVKCLGADFKTCCPCIEKLDPKLPFKCQ